MRHSEILKWLDTVEGCIGKMKQGAGWPPRAIRFPCPMIGSIAEYGEWRFPGDGFWYIDPVVAHRYNAIWAGLVGMTVAFTNCDPFTVPPTEEGE